MFADRSDAGRQLATLLLSLRGHDVVVLGLPRGGVPVAVEVAAALGSALDVVVVRKLGVPFQPELAMGAIGEGAVRVLDADTIATIGISAHQLAEVETRERRALDARVAALRRGRTRIDLNGRTAVIVDDGLATGSTARVACQVVRRLGASRVIVGVPVAPAATVANLPEADEVVCVLVPHTFVAVGVHYRDFRPVGEAEVLALLDAAS